MTHKPVGVGTSFAITTTAAASVPISVQTKSIRIVADQAAAHVSIGSSPVATVTDYFIPSGQSTVLLLEVGTQIVSGMTTGSYTTVTFAEGTGTVFGVGDYVSFTSTLQPYWNFTHQQVISVNTDASYDGSFSTGIGISYNSAAAGIMTAFTAPDGVMRKSIKVSARTSSGSGTLYAQQVQVTGAA
jgi:hypothetical protein